MNKSEMRARMRSIVLIESEESARVTAGLRSWMSTRLPGTVAAYLAMPSEVDVAPLFDALPGWRWVLPRVEPDRGVTFRDRDVPRELHPFGMRQPVDSGDPVPTHEIDMFLVPGVAFDLTGRRLGNGGGFYDRILGARRKDALAVGIAGSSRLVDSVPTESHDERMNFLATETGVSECSSTR